MLQHGWNAMPGWKLVCSKRLAYVQYSVSLPHGPARLVNTHLALVFMLYDSCSTMHCGNASCLSGHVCCNLATWQASNVNAKQTDQAFSW